MPRFYLHIRDADRFLEDPDGSELPDLTAARAEAIVSARHLLADRVRAGEVLTDQSFEITDETGKVLEVLPMKDVLRLS